ncbi:MAG: paraslipin [Proteobacteria bacterium]|nr:paraslipin [Pseudomonadota bacterium]
MFPVTLTLIAALAMWKGIKIVPQNYAYIVERLGRYDRTLSGGLHFIIPFIDRVSYIHSLKEVAVDVAAQSAITQDNVKLEIDGIVYIKIIDPVKASYGIEDMRFGIMQLAQTTMRSEIGKIGLDKTFEEREHLNVSIVKAINEAADSWGVQCLRYEIKDIQPPATILKAMELQVAAEREKRALILDSEGKRQAQINMAEAARQEQVLRSEGEKLEQINIAEGEANAIRAVAEARADGIRKIAEAISAKGGDGAVAQQIAEKYVDAFQSGMRAGTVIMLPTNTGDVNSLVTQALTTFNAVRTGDAGRILRGDDKAAKGAK